jgi:membrane-associated protein
MDFLGAILDFVLHVDVHLTTFVRSYGAWVYALLFAIIFVETGVVVMPFLPGDSLLFAAGCGSTPRDVPYTDLQYLSVAALTRALRRRYPIRDVVGHNDIAPGRKTDPGPAFDWKRFRHLTVRRSHREASQG